MTSHIGNIFNPDCAFWGRQTKQTTTATKHKAWVHRRSTDWKSQGFQHVPHVQKRMRPTKQGFWLPWWLAQPVKNLPAVRKTRVPFLGREDPLEKGMEPTPVFLPGESHGQRSLVGYSPWCHKESGMTEWLTISLLYWEVTTWMGLSKEVASLRKMDWGRCNKIKRKEIIYKVIAAFQARGGGDLSYSGPDRETWSGLMWYRQRVWKQPHLLDLSK